MSSTNNRSIQHKCDKMHVTKPIKDNERQARMLSTRYLSLPEEGTQTIDIQLSLHISFSTSCMHIVYTATS